MRGDSQHVLLLGVYFLRSKTSIFLDSLSDSNLTEFVLKFQHKILVTSTSIIFPATMKTFA